MESNENEVEEVKEEVQQEAGENRELVALPEASDADIESYLSSSTDKSAESSSSEISPPQAAAEKQTDSQQKSVEPKKAESEAKFLEAKTLPEVVSREEFNRLKGLFEQQEQFLKRRNTELGELRKERARLAAEAKQLQEKSHERFAENPDAWLQDNLKVRENERRIRELESQEMAESKIERTQAVFHKYVKPEEADFDSIAQALERDGIPAEAVNQFRSNPFAVMTEDGLIQAQKRVQAEKAFLKAVQLAKNLIEENKKLKSKPQEVMQGLTKALKSGPTVTASNGGGGGVSDAFLKNPTSMSDDELSNFLTSR